MRQLDSTEFYPLGDAAVVVRFGDSITLPTHRTVVGFTHALHRQASQQVTDIVPAFTSVTVHYDPLKTSYEQMVAWLGSVLQQPARGPLEEPNQVEIPVCYGGDYGPDLTVVATHSGLSEAEVIRIHSAGTYLVYMVGFAPGFPYLGGMPPEIATPRRGSPRLTIPAGSVGIAGAQTGVYPIATPGGWQLIGRTPKALFRPDAHPPTLFKAGDVVRFQPISADEFERWEAHTPS
jgi:inhibitor of KinA